MANNWLRITARSYWHSFTLACLVWGGMSLFAINLGLVSIGFRMPVGDSLLAISLGLLGSLISLSRTLRLQLNRWPILLKSVAFSLLVVGCWELTAAFQTNLYVFRGVLAILAGSACLVLPFFTGENRVRSDGNWLWIMLLLYLLASIWWLYALNQPLKSESVLQDSVPGIILVGHFVILTLLYICRDIVSYFFAMQNERDKALDRLRRSEQHYRSLFDHNPSAAFSLDLSGRFTDLNKTGEEYLQTSKENVLGLHYEYVLASSEMAKVAVVFNRALQGESMHYETSIVRKSGERMVLNVNNIPMMEDGRVLGVFGIARDITHLKQTYTELEQVNDELQNFAAVASHDLQEPLRKIVRFGELLQQAQLPEKERDYLERMVSASRRMQQLIHEILELARLGRDSLQVQTTDLSSIVQGVTREHEAQIASMGAQFDVSLKHEVEVDPELMKRVFDNLVTNAIKYARKDRKLKMTLYSQRVSADNVAVYFSDNGIGIEASHHQAVFKPFKRLHSRGDIPGTGMGLAIVKKIVDLHHGDVVLSSQSGEGTTIKIILPKGSELG
ncbi:sensor histidine kinase [Idiomarina sp. HP20-50]|uniref:sensor histidine kinase n=1 Tax=Idiomarina sp. HP20-50 TaxID=3070813 RepID=UPI00294ADF6B|nr:ATP-binding protein [Idiomarina sp. HP20-50]MDV6316996.1 PAS domain S-box protein [Idiomarina sp. HP20-50]